MNQIKITAKDQNKTSPPLVTFAVQPFVGNSLEEASQKKDEMLRKIPIEAALTRISGTFGVDLSEVDIDKPLQKIRTQASQGLVNAMSTMFKDKEITLREAVRLSGLSGLIPQILGTPEMIADELEYIWRETGCHGFNITPAIVPKGYEDFVDSVVPILQKRGIFRKEYEADNFKGNLLS